MSRSRIKSDGKMDLTTRLKRSKALIRLVRPYKMTPDDLIYPIFVREDGKSYEIPSMKGQRYLSLENSVEICRETVELGIPAVMIFAILKNRNADGSVALEPGNFNLEVLKRLKKEFGDEIVLISNVCLCTYTTEETCVYSRGGKVLNEETSVMLGKISVAHAEAGADVVAPAAMADGQVRHIRDALDREGFEDIPVMSYIKSDSCLFQPYYKAVSSSDKPRAGVDSSKFRTDIINRRMFLRKIDLDIREGADIVIIKPALTNLDIISMTRERYPKVSIAAFQVSGEYAMIKAADEMGYLNGDTVMLETLNSIKRAGADMILTYDALNVARLLKGSF